MSDNYERALEELEKVGWPCSLQELPQLYAQVSRELQQARERTLEEAACMVERSHGFGSMAEETLAKMIAKEIRALKNKSEG